jgi:serine/threonine-protein kinase
MLPAVKKEIELEIGHVLFIDIVAYSKLSISEQHARIEELNDLVRSSEQFRKAEAANRILKIPTGDGMALVFYKSPEEPAECAFEISRALKEHPRLQIRMGIHSGTVSAVVDVNERMNVAGPGINRAQRVMDCGDAGHILLTRHVAEDLAEYERWPPFLHDIGNLEVKHGVQMSITNLYSDEVGNPQLPSRLQTARKRRVRVRWAEIAASLLVLAAIVGGAFFFFRRPTPSTLGIIEKSIAVLPFKNLSDEKQNEYFADGVQDQILTDLSQIADLKVISRTSVMQYKSGIGRNLRKIGEELGVANVVEGSVQRAGNKIRVNAQLIDARNDAHLWANTYDKDLADVFAIQSEIAKAIADQLQLKLSPNEKKAIEQPPTRDVEAFNLYSRAKSLLLTVSFSLTEDQDVRKAIELLDEAVKRDPSFFDAYCQLVYANGYLYSVVGDHTPARLALAEAALQAAARLRPDAGETHLARAQYLYNGRRDYAGALGELEIARQALPNDPRLFELIGLITRRRGQQEEGLRNLQRAVELDPRNLYTLQQIAISYQTMGRYAEAITAFDRALDIVPDNIETQGYRALFELYWKGDARPLHQTIDSILARGPGAIANTADLWFACALAERDSAAAERALAALGGDNPCWGEGTIRLSRSFGEGLVARMTKDEGRAHIAFEAARAQQEKIVQAQQDYGPALCVLAMIDAALGHKDQALEEGRRAIVLTPLEKDVDNGSLVIQYFAITAAWAGENELALQQLETGLRAPVASVALSYGGLKRLPFWDPLLGDPRFEEIVASLAPK